MISPDERTKASIARLRTTSEFGTVVEWFKREVDVSLANFVACNNERQLPVLQNTVRVLEQIVKHLEGDDYAG